MLSQVNYTIKQLNEQAVVIQFDSIISNEILNQVLTHQKVIMENKFPGLVEVVPSYCSLTLYYDLGRVNQSDLHGKTAFEKIKSFLESLSNETQTPLLKGVHHTIPVCYDWRCGPDLPELSNTLQLSTDEIILMHTKNEYTVFLIGFTPGFPYMGVLPNVLECKRRDNPRKKVPPGSVAIAGKQTGIYPFETPGGWQIIGRTPVTLFSVENKQPSLLKPGDTVKFESISFQEFERLERR